VSHLRASGSVPHREAEAELTRQIQATNVQEVTDQSAVSDRVDGHPVRVGSFVKRHGQRGDRLPDAGRVL
jgi:hypothetical protein